MIVTKKNGKLMLSDGFYAFGKKLVQLVIPAVSSLYFALASIWHLPAAGQVVGTLAVLATFLGTLLHISSTQYDASGAKYDGNLVVTPDPQGEGKTFSFELNDHPSALVDKKEVSFKVADVPEVPPPLPIDPSPPVNPPGAQNG